ncbi:MAG: bifunctional metallophosphatase/5'-nucleotidase [Rubrivivax sp.]
MKPTRLLAFVFAALLAACATPPEAPLRVKILAINDFHGNLKTPSGGIRIADPADRTKTVVVPAGGAEHLASAVAELKAKNPNHVFVAAGDLVGASPLLSSLFHDEPTVESLSAMGLEASAVGNHEFDQGAAELLRLQRGGCAADGCKGPNGRFDGARWQYLAASTVDLKSGSTLFPAVYVKRFEGVPVAFIGLTLKATPSIVVPSGVAGLEFRDEAETVNALVPGLKAQGIEAIVVLIHEGGQPTGDYNECPGISGPIVGIVEKLDKAVDVVISGHTHRAYNCRIAGRLVTSGDKFGSIVTQIDLTIDRRTRDVTAAVADNVIVRPERFAKDPRQTQLIAAYEALARPLAQRVVGRIEAPLSRDANAAGEMPLGQLIADAQLEATRDAGAQIALMNPGGIRTGLAKPADGQLRYEDLFASQPFYNNLVTITLSGAELAAVLEQQWQNQPVPRVLQISNGLTYAWDASQPAGRRVVPGSLKLDGKPIAPEASLRITVNGFLAAGGDNFGVLKQGREARTGIMDIEALERYVAHQPALKPLDTQRIVRLN